jgi:phosphoribosyl 1,2-cyclic phosphate phosphodiesterase
MSLELLFLGTGTSAGIPMIACDCDVCTSSDPRDQRNRPSVLVSYPDTINSSTSHNFPPDGIRRMLIDTSPELRQQALAFAINRIDGVLYTHAHADHVFGLDDLRRFNAAMDAAIDIYAEDSTLDTLRKMFQYIFEAHTNINKTFIATLLANRIAAGEAMDLYGAHWTPVRLMHGRLPILGYRVDFNGMSLAYCTDVSTIPPESYDVLAGLDVLVIDALRFRHHPTHQTIEQALRVAEQLAPTQTFFTHLAHDVKHAAVDPTLPDGVRLSYDGLRVVLDGESGRRVRTAGAFELT